MTSGLLDIDKSISHVTFCVKKLGFLTVKGTLSGFDGTIYIDERDMESSFFDVCLTPVTVNTGNPKRDQHLKSVDFFYAKNYPIICFKSISVLKVNDEIHATGILTMLGTTKDILIPLQYGNGTISGSFSLNRKDFGLGKKFPAIIVGNRVDIAIHCEIDPK